MPAPLQPSAAALRAAAALTSRLAHPTQTPPSPPPPTAPTPPVSGGAALRVVFLADAAARPHELSSAAVCVAGLAWRVHVNTPAHCDGFSVALECLGRSTGGGAGAAAVGEDGVSAVALAECADAERVGGEFVADGLVSFYVVPVRPRAAVIQKALPYHLTEAGSAVRVGDLFPASPPFVCLPSSSPSPTFAPPQLASERRRCADASQLPRKSAIPQLWRSYTDPDLGVVDKTGSMTVRVDFVVYSPRFAVLASRVDAAFPSGAGEPNWLAIISAVREEPSLARRAVSEHGGGGTLLGRAISDGKFGYARFLLAAGADAGGGGAVAGGGTPLHAAVQSGCALLVEELVHRFGADVEARDCAGESCIFRVARVHGERAKASVLRALVWSCHASMRAVSANGSRAVDVVGDDVLRSAGVQTSRAGA